MADELRHPFRLSKGRLIQEITDFGHGLGGHITCNHALVGVLC